MHCDIQRILLLSWVTDVARNLYKFVFLVWFLEIVRVWGTSLHRHVRLARTLGGVISMGPREHAVAESQCKIGFLLWSRFNPHIVVVLRVWMLREKFRIPQCCSESSGGHRRCIHPCLSIWNQCKVSIFLCAFPAPIGMSAHRHISPAEESRQRESAETHPRGSGGGRHRGEDLELLVGHFAGQRGAVLKTPPKAWLDQKITSVFHEVNLGWSNRRNLIHRR